MIGAKLIVPFVIVGVLIALYAVLRGVFGLGSPSHTPSRRRDTGGYDGTGTTTASHSGSSSAFQASHDGDALTHRGHFRDHSHRDADGHSGRHHEPATTQPSDHAYDTGGSSFDSSGGDSGGGGGDGGGGGGD